MACKQKESFLSHTADWRKLLHFLELEMLISAVCRNFLNHCSSALTLSKHTIRAYKTDLKSLEIYFLSKRLEEVKTDDLREYIRYLRSDRCLKESTIKRQIACVKLLFRWAIKEEIVFENPFDRLSERIRLPKRLPRALEGHHTRLLANSVSILSDREGFDRIANKIAIHVLLETGVRVGELTAISLDDVSLLDRRIKIIGKGNRQRIVYFLSQSLYKSIDYYLDRRKRIPTQTRSLFVSTSGHPKEPYEIRKALKEIAQGAGIDRNITPHMLRHTCATRWLEDGLDIRFVQKLLGHHSISTTEIYTHVSDTGLRNALERIAGGRAM